MKKIVFVIGRPGSGKSSAATLILELAKKRELSAQWINDYTILQQWFLADVHHERFEPLPHNGFNAIDMRVMDEVLVDLEKQAVASGAEFVLLEFARDEYRRSLRFFSSALLQAAYYIYLEAEVEICLQRIRDRVLFSQHTSDHPTFPEEKFRKYYGKDNLPYIQGTFAGEFGVPSSHILGIETSSLSLPQVLDQVESFFGRTISSV